MKNVICNCLCRDSDDDDEDDGDDAVADDDADDDDDLVSVLQDVAVDLCSERWSSGVPLAGRGLLQGLAATALRFRLCRPVAEPGACVLGVAKYLYAQLAQGGRTREEQCDNDDPR